MKSETSVQEIVNVDLGDRAYEIRIGYGLIREIGNHISDILRRPKVVIVADRNVADLHLDTLLGGLKASGIEAKSILIEPGEASKSFSVLEQLLDDLLAMGVERNDRVIAFGGGVVGDLVGFASSILRRGIDFIQIPTTLLAQVDSSVGGKTGINTPRGKNLVGTFHQPLRVIMDLDLLATLPLRELRAGYAEVVKYGLIDDPVFFEWLEENGHLILSANGDKAATIHAISKSCQAKARIVAEDERESGKRALLNLGHTFGHALEAECGYDGTLLHGEAVAIGMVMALDLGHMLGLADACDKDRLIKHLRAMDMRATIADISVPMDAETLLAHMAQDKKVEDGKLVFITGGIGEATIRKDIDKATVLRVLESALEA
jgi:3-dehydroquinate synthase